MPISEHVDIFSKIVNVTGLLAFSLSGAVAAIKKDADIFGVLMLALVSFIFKTEIYATAAFLGALIMVLGKLWFPGEEKLVMLVGATACSSLRLIALHYRWNMYSVK